jgi:hypothetical protein
MLCPQVSPWSSPRWRFSKRYADTQSSPTLPNKTAPVPGNNHELAAIAVIPVSIFISPSSFAVPPDSDPLLRMFLGNPTRRAQWRLFTFGHIPPDEPGPLERELRMTPSQPA